MPGSLERLIRGGIARFLPPAVLYRLLVLRGMSGTATRTCPACGYSGRFTASGEPPRYDAVCGGCGSRERHRLVTMAVERLRLLAPGDRVLHFAPEGPLRPWLAKRLKPRNYVSADLTPGSDLTLNLEAIDQPDATWDVVIANHVLEHVNDALALGEIFRILRPGGRLIATVPLVEGWDVTYDDPSVTSRPERQLHFGQEDHVRYYGRDFREHVRGAGFDLDEFVATGAETARHGLVPGERVFIGRKR